MQNVIATHFMGAADSCQTPEEIDLPVIDLRAKADIDSRNPSKEFNEYADDETKEKLRRLQSSQLYQVLLGEMVKWDSFL